MEHLWSGRIKRKHVKPFMVELAKEGYIPMYGRKAYLFERDVDVFHKTIKPSREEETRIRMIRDRVIESA